MFAGILWPHNLSGFRLSKSGFWLKIYQIVGQWMLTVVKLGAAETRPQIMLMKYFWIFEVVVFAILPISIYLLLGKRRR